MASTRTRTRRPAAPAPAPVRRAIVVGGGKPAARSVTPRQAWGKTRSAGMAVVSRQPYSAKHLLFYELLVGVIFVIIRAVADYEPQQGGGAKGKIGHPKGQLGPLPVFAGLLGTFFLLSFLAARGGTRGKVAVAGGGLVVLVLGMKSATEFEKVAGTFGTWGQIKTTASSSGGGSSSAVPPATPGFPAGITAT